MSLLVKNKNTIIPIINEKITEYNINKGIYTKLTPDFLLTCIIHDGLVNNITIIHKINDAIIDNIQICIGFFLSIFIYIK